MIRRQLVLTAAAVLVAGLKHENSAFADDQGPLRHTPGFMAFSRDVERLNNRYRHAEGFEHFVDIVEVSASSVQLTAHARWIKAPIEERQRSLNLMVNLWALRAEEAPDTKVTLLIVDERGIPVMKGSR